MPDLSELRPLFGRVILHAMIGKQAVSPKATLYRTNFIRLVDKAVKEYHAARDSILAQLAEASRPAPQMEEEGRPLYILAFTDHCETCVNAIHRVLRLVDRLKDERQPLNRDLRHAIEAYSRAVPAMRNALEHMDERIQRDEVAPGQPVMLGLADSEDRAVVADTELLFDDVAIALRKLHAIGQALFES